MNVGSVKIMLRKDDEYFYATSARRYRSAADVNLSDLDPIPTPASKIWPQFPRHFKRAPEPLSENCYVKRPSLLLYGDTEASTELSDLVLHEAQVCEILRGSPHPNIAQYLGYIVKMNHNWFGYRMNTAGRGNRDHGRASFASESPLKDGGSECPRHLARFPCQLLVLITTK